VLTLYLVTLTILIHIKILWVEESGAISNFRNTAIGYSKYFDICNLLKENDFYKKINSINKKS
jgi:hypothetical protein